jgi:hypothetical protein
MKNPTQRSLGIDGKIYLTSEIQDGLQCHTIIGEKERVSKFS